jgi:hypothetical protein
MISIVSQGATTTLRPKAPLTLAETGLSFETVTDMVLKTLHRWTELSGTDVARRLALHFSMVEPSLELLKTQRHCEIAGGPMMGGPSFRDRLTDAGRAHASAILAHNQYTGVAPVSIAEYRAYSKEFRNAVPRAVRPEDVRRAFSHLVVSDRVLDEIGPAVNSGHSIFMYGPPGNGKTVMSSAIRKLLAGTIAIPHALDVNGETIRFFDPTVHERVPMEDDEPPRDEEYDRRWVMCRRPIVAVGGELTLESLALVYNPHSGLYRAPVQMLANGGVLLIDEFGRQRCHPRDLLNWWMVPLESGFETLTLQSGEKIDMPFFPLVIFSTNLKPSELVDEAFLRRIRYKIYAESPTAADFVRIFKLACDEQRIPFDRTLVDRLLDEFYRPRGIEMRSCHPRDLINQALALASYRQQPRQLTAALLDDACVSYFIEDHEDVKGSGRKHASE